MAIECDKRGNLYVAHFDFYNKNKKKEDQFGTVLYISAESGQVLQRIVIPHPEVRGLCLSENNLFVCAGSSIYWMSQVHHDAELEKN